jgi:DMSO/TMAO reductase YedYZ molybdopterin-dependent catalytic subunit
MAYRSSHFGGELNYKSRLKSNRREFLRLSGMAGGVAIAGFPDIFALESQIRQDPNEDNFAGGKRLGTLDFVDESRLPLDRLMGAELDGRLFSDLSKFGSENPFPPTGVFYVRTRASDLFRNQKDWGIKVYGLVEKPITLGMDDLRKGVRPVGLHLMECAGNTRATRFGLLSVADWSGVPVSAILEPCKPRRKATRVVISGFDRYSTSSTTSVAGAEWVFTLEQLQAANAFLTTTINGQPLTPDHGAPVRLVVPGWYGCTCIKWVNEIRLVDDEVEATSQMQEFAGRTHQQGAPKLAKDYRPATIDQAAMPTRVEKWLVGGEIKYRVVGILWGGSRLVKSLEIRFNPDEDYVPVDSFSQTYNDPWSFWAHGWMPKSPGTHMIRLRVADPAVESKRLDSGHYVRSVEVPDV